MSGVGVIQSLIFAGACLLGFGALRLASRLVQAAAILALCLLGGAVLGTGLMQGQSGPVLGGLLILAFAAGLDAVLHDIRRAHAALPPCCEAPGAPSGAGDAAKRDGERDAPMLPMGVSSTAGSAGLPRSFSGVPR